MIVAAAVTLPVSHDQKPQLITNMYSVILSDVQDLFCSNLKVKFFPVDQVTSVPNIIKETFV